MPQTSVFRSIPRSESASSPVSNRDAGQPSFDRIRPLVLDLEGTLLRTNLLIEGIVALLRRNILMVFPLILWLLKDKATFRREITARITPDISLLPANEALVAFAAAEKARGRMIVLAADIDEPLAQQLMRRFSFLDRVITGDSEAKTQQLRDLFPEGFHYAGDAHADLAVWQAADHVIVVEAERDVLRRVAFFGRPTTNFAAPSRFKALIKGLRLNFWAGNTLVFAPLLLSGKTSDLSAWLLAGSAFLALGLVASASNLLNDLRELPADRARSLKSHRPESHPLASGNLPVATGMLAAAAALALGLAIGGLAGTGALIGLMAYGAAIFIFAMKDRMKHALTAATALALMLATAGLPTGLLS
jgi:hypothetical protein